MKVLVCGGRDFANRHLLETTLNRFQITELIHGDARGADRLAGCWAFDRGIPVQAFPANWERDGKAAGLIRNDQMLKIGRPDLVIAFTGGKGTADMVQRARKAGVKVEEIT